MGGGNRRRWEGTRLVGNDADTAGISFAFTNVPRPSRYKCGTQKEHGTVACVEFVDIEQGDEACMRTLCEAPRETMRQATWMMVSPWLGI